ncbi:MAG TPA: hypothetical protein VI381_04495 [Allosphingosinicella sp.]
MKILTSGLAATALALAACSAEPAGNARTAPAASNATAPKPRPAAPRPAAAPSARANVLTLEGLGALRIGAPVPENSGWSMDEAAIEEVDCRTVSSPDYPGVYAIVQDGVVRRISVEGGGDERSDVKLANGLGLGATEAKVRAAYPGLREDPHEYVRAPAKYLTAPDAESGKPAVRFETGADGKVSVIHVGTIPVLYYIEGCS